MRTAFINSLIECSRENKNIWLLTADLGFSVLEKFREEFPDRFINVGVAEQNMIGVAAGLALSGKKVFVYSIANFPTLRCLEQIRNDICYHNLDVTVVAVGGGMSYGSLGFTHHGLEDLAILRTLPNITVSAPGDPLETQIITTLFCNSKGPSYLRLGKVGEKIVHKDLKQLKSGDAIQLVKGTGTAIISTGSVLELANEIRQLAEDSGVRPSLFSFPFLKPFDRDCATNVIRNHSHVITIEEHKSGGLGTIFAEFMAESRNNTRLSAFKIQDNPPGYVGSQQFLRNNLGLNKGDILQCLVENHNSIISADN